MSISIARIGLAALPFWLLAPSGTGGRILYLRGWDGAVKELEAVDLTTVSLQGDGSDQ